MRIHTTATSPGAPNQRISAKGVETLRLAEVVLAAWHLRYAWAPTWHLRIAETSSHTAVLGVELDQPLRRKSCIPISQHIGRAANPGGRADGNRKQRGSRALTAHALAVQLDRSGSI